MTTSSAPNGSEAEREARRARRLAVFREHAESENVLEFERTMATFSRPRYELIATGAEHEGADEVMAYFRDGRAVFPDQRNEEIATHVADDVIVYEFWLTGTHLGGPNPTGRRIRCRMCAIFDFDDDDLITCERVYFDQNTIRRQLLGEEDVTD